MFARQKSIRSRTKRPRRKRSKYLTPDLALVNGQLLRVVSTEDNPLSRAERLHGEYAKLGGASFFESS